MDKLELEADREGDPWWGAPGNLSDLCRLPINAQWTLWKAGPLWREKDPNKGAGVRGGAVPWKAQRGALDPRKGNKFKNWASGASGCFNQLS